MQSQVLSPISFGRRGSESNLQPFGAGHAIGNAQLYRHSRVSETLGVTAGQSPATVTLKPRS